MVKVSIISSTHSYIHLVQDPTLIIWLFAHHAQSTENLKVLQLAIEMAVLSVY